MNINDFNVAMRSIISGVDLADLNLKNKRFYYKARQEFNESLTNLRKLLMNDVDHTFISNPAWHTAHRIVQFKKLYTKIEEIRAKILHACKTSNSKPYFLKKIGSDILPALANRTKILLSDIGKKGRLPFSVGKDRDNFYLEVKNSLQMKDIAKIIHVQKEYFHLMANRFDKSIENEINVKEYTGSWEVYSLESWEKVIKLFIDKGTDREKEIGKKILEAIQKALPLAVKICFAYGLNQIIEPLDDAQQVAYLTDLVDSEKPLAKWEMRKITPEQFLQKYELANASIIPKNVIINEMAWDMVTIIQKLQKGEFHLFFLGTRYHSIAMQVTCIEAATHVNKGGVYTSTTFNTGEGVEVYHQLNETGLFAYPLTFVNVPLETFSYTFCYDLICFCLQSDSVNKFYNLHDTVLVEQGSGSKVKDCGALYQLQDFETCAYSSGEAWINSFLTPDQQLFLEFIKAQFSTSKQEEVIKIFEEQVESSSWIKVASTRKPKLSQVNPIHIENKKKLKESKILLNKGRKRLETLKGLIKEPFSLV